MMVVDVFVFLMWFSNVIGFDEIICCVGLLSEKVR